MSACYTVEVMKRVRVGAGGQWRERVATPRATFWS